MTRCSSRCQPWMPATRPDWIVLFRASTTAGAELPGVGYHLSLHPVWLSRTSEVRRTELTPAGATIPWFRAPASGPTSPQVAAGEHVDERHKWDQTEDGPRHLGAAPDIGARSQVNPNEDDGERMQQTDEEFEKLLHCTKSTWAGTRGSQLERGRRQQPECTVAEPAGSRRIR